MTDEELCRHVGIAPSLAAGKWIESLSPGQREVFERMKFVAPEARPAGGKESQ